LVCPKNIYLSDRDVAKIVFFRFLSKKIRSNLSVTPMHKNRMNCTLLHFIWFSLVS